MQFIDDLFAKLSGFIEQAEVGRVANRLRRDSCVADEFALMMELGFLFEFFGLSA